MVFHTGLNLRSTLWEVSTTRAFKARVLGRLSSGPRASGALGASSAPELGPSRTSLSGPERSDFGRLPEPARVPETREPEYNSSGSRASGGLGDWLLLSGRIAHDAVEHR